MFAAQENQLLPIPFVACGLVAAMVGGATAVWLIEPVAAQTRTAASSQWTAPRAPDGHPDLQGNWLSRSATPLERPAALAGKARLSDQELAELKARAQRIFNSAGSSDFAAGDAVFLAALANRDRFTSPTSTHGASAGTGWP